jgi:hypothetical protein
MISVDNFYYVLYKNLLEHTRITPNYYYPFGKTDLQSSRFMWDFEYRLHSDHLHSMLFYDQEPILNETLTYINRALFTNKFCKILANSEKSEIKKVVCKKNQFLDWYYFYHGFASLYWYNDYKYLAQVENPFTKLFISYNRLHTNLRSYRLNLVNEYIKYDLLQHGSVSLPLTNDSDSWKQELDNPYTLLPQHKLKEIKDNLTSLNGPLIIDKVNPEGFLSAECGGSQLQKYQSALWHIVSETIFYHDKLHLTEKIFKPIVSKRPFMLVGAAHNLSYLKSYGFQTFDRWIDESYDLETDNDKRISMIVNELRKLSLLNMNQLRDMHKEMQSVLEFNFNHFYNDFKTIIVDELLNNFQTCVRIYNHARYDDTDIPIHLVDFDNVRKLFLR